MKHAALMLTLAVTLAPDPSFGASFIRLGENANKREILVNPATLKTLPPIPEVRDFPVVQISVIMRGPPPRGSTERVRYNFHCRTRKAAAVIYYRVANGKKSHDWLGADISMKYHPVDRGGLVEMALNYACAGGKIAPSGTRATGSRNEEEDREEHDE
jgi:hypothetical protein